MAQSMRDLEEGNGLPFACHSGNDCSTCTNAVKAFMRINTEPYVLVTHLNILEDLKGRKKVNKNKEKKKEEIGRYLSALRNSNGGVLLIHFFNKADEDNYLGTFDEFLEDTLKQLLCDGESFSDCYSRKWLSEHPEYPEYNDILVFTAAKTVSVSTVDLKTKVTSDLQIERPSNFKILSQNTYTYVPVKPKLRGIKEIYNLHESREIQLKGFYPNRDHCNAQDSPESFAECIWKTLRLREYVSTMSKLPNGGSFYLGVTEKVKEYAANYDRSTLYESKIPTVSGFELKMKQLDLRVELTKLISSEVTIRRQNLWVDEGTDFVVILFHDTETNKVVIEIAIGHVNGLLYYDKNGPEAYEIKERNTVRIPRDEWFRRNTGGNMIIEVIAYNRRCYEDNAWKEKSIVCISTCSKENMIRKRRIVSVSDDGIKTKDSILFTSDSDTRENIVYMNNLQENLSLQNKQILDKIKQHFNNNNTWMYVDASLMTTLDYSNEKNKPDEILFDVIIFSPSRTTLVLTVTKEMNRNAEAYNVDLARFLTFIVREDSVNQFTPSHVVIGKDIIERGSDYEKSILVSTMFAIPDSIMMNMKKLKNVIRSFTKATESGPQMDNSKDKSLTAHRDETLEVTKDAELTAVIQALTNEKKLMSNKAESKEIYRDEKDESIWTVKENMMGAYKGEQVEINMTEAVETNKDEALETDQYGAFDTEKDGALTNKTDGTLKIEKDEKMETEKDGTLETENEKDGILETENEKDGTLETKKDETLEIEKDGTLETEKKEALETDRASETNETMETYEDGVLEIVKDGTMKAELDGAAKTEKDEAFETDSFNTYKEGTLNTDKNGTLKDDKDETLETDKDRAMAIQNIEALMFENDRTMEAYKKGALETRKDSTSLIHICVTMWQEERREMLLLVKSVLSLYQYHQDVLQTEGCFSAGCLIKDTHIMFDDAFNGGPTDTMVNKYVMQFVSVLKDCTREMFHEDLLIPVSVNTPYGGQLVWTLPTGNIITLHLKDSKKIRKGKRSSQIMYCFLKKAINADFKDDYSFLLNLDGGTAFSPQSLGLLIEKFKTNPNVGAICERIHLKGALMWHQELENTIQYCVQKYTQRNIPCGSGCFILYRGSALMKEEVMRDYYILNESALQKNEYDYGEKTVLCTLLIQHDYRVEYSDDAKAHVYGPEGFISIIRHRQRLKYSALLNIRDLILFCSRSPTKSSCISTFFIVCSLFLLYIVPHPAFIFTIGLPSSSLLEMSFIRPSIWTVCTIFMTKSIYSGIEAYSIAEVKDDAEFQLTLFFYWLLVLNSISMVIPTTRNIFYIDIMLLLGTFAAFFMDLVLTCLLPAFGVQYNYSLKNNNFQQNKQSHPGNGNGNLAGFYVQVNEHSEMLPGKEEILWGDLIRMHLYPVGKVSRKWKLVMWHVTTGAIVSYLLATCLYRLNAESEIIALLYSLFLVVILVGKFIVEFFFVGSQASY